MPHRLHQEENIVKSGVILTHRIAKILDQLSKQDETRLKYLVTALYPGIEDKFTWQVVHLFSDWATTLERDAEAQLRAELEYLLLKGLIIVQPIDHFFDRKKSRVTEAHQLKELDMSWGKHIITLTEKGRAFVAQGMEALAAQIQPLNDPKVLRNAVLQLLYDRTGKHPSTYWLQHVLDMSTTQLRDELGYLQKKEYLTSGYGYCEITAEGMRFVEAGFRDVSTTPHFMTVSQTVYGDVLGSAIQTVQISIETQSNTELLQQMESSIDDLNKMLAQHISEYERQRREEQARVLSQELQAPKPNLDKIREAVSLLADISGLINLGETGLKLVQRASFILPVLYTIIRELLTRGRF
jgi:hypothetical protein